ncbi:MAG: fimbrillin family protein [Alistipes sp.]|nr:fimbrillin family protein [Candidatus Alistipes equi]
MQTITTLGTTYECLLVPSEVETNKQTISLTLTIDGNDKKATLSENNGVIFVQGTKSNITITLSNGGISVQTVSVEDWNVVEVGEHKVTMKIDEVVVPNDILTDIHVEWQTVIIKAISTLKRPLSCDVGDLAQCHRVKDNDMYTFTISNISSNVEAVLSYSKFTVTVLSDSNGKVWIGDDRNRTSGQFYSGQQLLIHATPNDKFRLFRWDDNIKEASRSITVFDTDITHSASFISPDLIPRLFSVSNGKQVFFSNGNLYCSNVIFN